MSTGADPFASYRGPLQARLQEALADDATAHAVLLRQHSAALPESSRLPALLCLLTADALAGRAEQALPAAASLVLLAEMSRVFAAIGGEGHAGGGLAATWGMPRALNAGDGFFVLAQSALLDADAGLDEEQRLRALSILDEAARAISEEQCQAAPSEVAGHRALFEAGASLGAVFAGADAATASRFAAFGRALGEGAPDEAQIAGLGAKARERLALAARYVMEAR